MNETTARRVTLVQAFDEAQGPLWSREDGQWASRLAAETAPPDASPEQLLAERARHALQRLEPRDASIGRWLGRAGWRWGWLGLAVGAGGVVGLAADLVGRGQHVDVLAPGVWAIVAWNLAMYAVLTLAALRHHTTSHGWFRRLVAAAWARGVGSATVRTAAERWADLSLPLTALRAAVVAHLAAAALAGGMIGGLYLRGLVFDYRAAWQSTFLEPPTVQAALKGLLAPAQALTGIAVPDEAAIAAMQLTPERPQPTASAAPWIHLYAATLVLWVVLPRLVLAVLAFLQATARSLRLPVPVPVGELQRLARWRRAGPALVQVLPYGQTPGAQTALGLRDLLAQELGDDLVLKIADVTHVGSEDAARLRVGTAGAVLRVALVDLGATPEDEHHGRFLRAVQDAQPPAALLVLVDEAAFRVRFASLPPRIDERRQSWLDFGQRHGIRLACVNLDRPELPEGLAALRQVMHA